MSAWYLAADQKYGIAYIYNAPRVLSSPDPLSIGVFDDRVGSDDRKGDSRFHVPDFLLVLLLEDEGAVVWEVVDFDAGLRYLSHDLKF